MESNEPPESSDAFKKWVEAYKKSITPEDLAWYEQEHETVPLSQIITELEDWMKRGMPDDPVK